MARLDCGVKPATGVALTLVLLVIGVAGQTAEPVVQDSGRPASPPSHLPLDQVCIYASRIYSQGARVTVEGATYTCIRDERGGMRWASLFQAQDNPKLQ